MQLWIALPAGRASGPADFEQHRDLPRFTADGLHGVVFVGELDTGPAADPLPSGVEAVVRSPATVYSPLVGADLQVEPGRRAVLQLRPTFEYAVLVLSGDLHIPDDPGAIGTEFSGTEFSNTETDGTDRAVPPGPLLYLGTGRSAIVLRSEHGARLIVLGGEPFADELVMWWNFVGRSHEEIVRARDEWQLQSERFGRVAAADTSAAGRWIPAPPLPALRLTPRRRH